MKIPVSSEEEREAMAQLEQAIAAHRVTAGIQTKATERYINKHIFVNGAVY